ncbi:23069_t:CDS:10 [Entrophospora sp. SA101]|nr:23069_t:CDS:10 [Entrophospora sp. SA101]
MPDVTTTVITATSPTVVTRQKYEEVQAELDELMKQRENLEESLLTLETSIYSSEGSYLEESGNLIRGFDGYLKPSSQQDKKKKDISKEARLFSNSSSSSRKVNGSMAEDESSSSDEYNKIIGRSSFTTSNKRFKRTHKKNNSSGSSHSEALGKAINFTFEEQISFTGQQIRKILDKPKNSEWEEALKAFRHDDAKDNADDRRCIVVFVSGTKNFIWSSVYTGTVCFWWFLGYISNKSRNGWKTQKIDWNDEIVVITGGSSGLGGLLAETLAIRTVTTIILDIKPPEIEHSNVIYYECDVSKLKNVEEVAKKIIEEVSIASVAGFSGISQLGDYCASKAALISFHETLRYELDTCYNAKNVRTTLVCPGLLRTKMFDGVQVEYPFITPPLAPLDVVKRIVTSLDKNQGEDILTPYYANLMPLLRFLPSFFHDSLHKAFKVDYGMKTWRGGEKND